MEWLKTLQRILPGFGNQGNGRQVIKNKFTPGKTISRGSLLRPGMAAPQSYSPMKWNPEDSFRTANRQYPDISVDYLRALRQQESQGGKMRPPIMDDFAGTHGWETGIRKGTFNSQEFRPLKLKADSSHDAIMSAAAISNYRKKNLKDKSDVNTYMQGYYTNTKDKVAANKFSGYLKNLR